MSRGPRLCSYFVKIVHHATCVSPPGGPDHRPKTYARAYQQFDNRSRKKKKVCPPGYLRCARGILLSAQLRPLPSPKVLGGKRPRNRPLSCPLLGLCVVLQTLHEALQLGCEIRVRRRLPLLLRDCVVRHTVIRNELSNRVQKRDQAASLVHGAESLPHGCIQRHVTEQ